MKNYVEIAKKKASDKRTEEAVRIEKEKAKREERRIKVDETMKLLKKALKQWNKKHGFTYKDCGSESYTDCAEIHRVEKLLGFRCYWDKWVAEYSDDYKTDEEGVTIKVTYHQERVEEYDKVLGYRRVVREDVFRFPRDPEELVDRCMESIAEYLSKFF